MITLTDEQLEKIDLLDQLFNSMSSEDLRKITEPEIISARLKGVDQSIKILRGLVQEYSSLQNDHMNTKNEMMVLKNDFRMLLRVLNGTLFSTHHSMDLGTLKSKYGVF